MHSFEKLKSAGIKTLKPAWLTIRFLVAVMIPVSLVVLLLDASGILFYVSYALRPVMRLLGLPGEAALVFISAIFLNIYSAIAVINTLHLSGAAVIIVATMCCIAHNFFVECIVTTKTGSSLIAIIVLRLVCAFAAGWLLHLLLAVPEDLSLTTETALHGSGAFTGALLLDKLKEWLIDTGKLLIKIVLMVFAVIFLQKLLDELGIMRLLGRITRPLMRIMGVPENCAYLWIVVELVGLAYGAGVLIEEVNSGAISRTEAALFNCHAVINHSQIEDTLLFVSIGVPYLWVALPRFIVALGVVWIGRGIAKLFPKNFHAALAEERRL
ncbi:MAG: transporter [Spirochaetaceae bacterium]|nr:transporter [Spirochaetaceae bacterium]